MQTVNQTDNKWSQFNDFNNLKPIEATRATSREKEHDEILFRIEIRDSEPWLVVEGNGVKSGKVLPQDSEVLREVRRAAALSSDGFNVVWDDERLEISLWESWWIVKHLAAVSHLAGPGGETLSFADESVQMILKLNMETAEEEENTENTKPEPAGDEEAESAREDVMVTPELCVRSVEGDLASPVILSEEYVLTGNRIFQIAPLGENFPKTDAMLAPVRMAMLPAFLSLFLTYFKNILPEYRGHTAHHSSTPEDAVATLVLEKVAADQALYLRLTSTVDSLEGMLPMSMHVSNVVSADQDGQILIRPVREVRLEEYASQLYDMISRSAPTRQARKEIYQDNDFFIVPAETASPFLLNHLPEVLDKFKLIGSENLKAYKVTPAVPKLKVSLTSGIDFLEGKAAVEVANETMTLADLLDRFEKNKYVALSDGNRAIIDPKYIKRLQRIFRLKGKNEKVRVSLFDLPEIEDMLKERISGTMAKKTRELFEGFNHLKSEKLPAQQVNAKLRGYQKEGVKWIKYLYDNNIGGCLADDMGLGKTLQTITVLSMLYPSAPLPTLIVMPRSLLFNWENEFRKFAPGITVATYYGPDRNLEECMKSQVVLSTYAVVRNDIDQLKDREFQYVVLDESQNIKNLASQSAQAVCLLKTQHRLALSGTPMENNLTELYSLFRFLNPTMFGTVEEFNSIYTYPIQKNGDNDAMQSLRRKIYPFLLRRLKKDVLKELPDRIEQTVYVEMNPSQAAFYERRRADYLSQIKETISREGIQKSQFVMFQALNELRRIASVPESLTEGRIKSPKVEELVEAVENAVANGHKTVVFFNYIAGLEIVGAKLEKMGINCETMTGSTTAGARKKIVEKFQTSPDCMVLLMTLKVGGVGLNLTAADTVFIFEPWWNKAAEEQAINRLHRIGQKATVTSYSLIAVNTIEEKILQLQEQKRELFDGLIGSDTASAKHLSEEDIDFILS